MKKLFENWRAHIKEEAPSNLQIPPPPPGTERLKKLAQLANLKPVGGGVEGSVNIPLPSNLTLGLKGKMSPDENFAGINLKGLFEADDALEEDLEEFDKETLQTKPELSPDIWQEHRLNTEIRTRLLQIAEDFFNSLKLDVDVLDVVFTGSLANYNWSKYSDIDLHIIINFSEVDENEELVREYVNAKKSVWNRAHKILIKGYEVEVYVENHSDTHHSSGVYSILRDDWLVMPPKQTHDLDWENIAIKTESFIAEVDSLEDLYDRKLYDQVLEGTDALKQKIKKFRSSGLELGGEYSIENLVFKVLRRTDYIGKLMRLRVDAYDKSMSINGSP